MSIWVQIDETSAVGDFAWETSLSPSEVRRLGTEGSNIGHHSVVGLTGGVEQLNGSQIRFDPDQVVVLNVGHSNRCLLIQLTDPEGVSVNVQAVASASGSARRGHGDEEFLAACRAHLRPDLVEMGEQLLKAVRNRYPGDMFEGKARKWVNYPGNFLALTIQNRSQSFAVHVKGDWQRLASSTLDVRRDRPGYARFKLETESQLEDAIKFVLLSASGAK